MLLLADSSDCMKLILASASPRRLELLAAADLDFTVVPSSAEEIHDSSLGMERLCEENARLKATAVSARYPEAAVIGADTLVFLDGVALGKPKSLDEAKSMLRRLSGRTHQVCTGVCIAGPGPGLKSLHCVTDVRFRELDESKISEYLAISMPLDKAGGYGIQDHGELIVASIEGSYENVMGLPVDLVVEALLGIGLPITGR